MSYKLKIGSDSAATFASLGISSAALRSDAEGLSTLEIEAAAEMGAAPLIEPFERVELQDLAGVVRFVGWCDEAPRSARGESRRIRYKLNGPHRWLERANFAQSRAGLVILAGAAGSDAAAPQGFNASAAEILTQALAIYPSSFAYGSLTAFTHQTPTRFRSDVDCLTALQSLMSYAPTACLYWTYPSGAPTLNLGAAATTADKTLSTSTHQISEADLNPRYDLLHDTVLVYYVRDATVSASETAGPGGEAASLGAARTKLMTFDTSVLNNYPATGLAAVMAGFYQRLHIDGSATKHEVDWTDRPGHIYGFSGGEFAQFSSRTTMLHTIERDLMNDSTKLSFGVLPGKLLYKVSDLDSAPTSRSSSTYTGAAALSKVEMATIKDIASPTNKLPQDKIQDLPADLEEKLPKPDGTPATLPVWVEVERCDGKKMKVLAQASWA